MSANTLTRQLDQVYNDLSSERADGLRVGVLNATSVTATTLYADTSVSAESFVYDVAGGTNGFYFDNRGAVTQASSITTGVAVEGLAGVITTVSSTLAAGSTVEFTVTNSEVAANDVVLCSCTSASAGAPVANVTHTAAGSFVVALQNVHDSAALDNTVQINFVVFKTAA